MSRERFRWEEEDHGEWICVCGEEFMVDAWEFTPCPNCNRSYKKGGGSDDIIREEVITDTERDIIKNADHLSQIDLMVHRWMHRMVGEIDSMKQRLAKLEENDG